MDFDKELIKYLKIANEDLLFKKQFRTRQRYLFDYIYRMIVDKRKIEKDIIFLDKIKMDSEFLKRKLSIIEKQLSNIQNKR